MADFDIEKHLFREVVVEKYGDKYIEHFLEQYKIYLEMLDKISDRRQSANEFCLALNTALLGFLGFIQSRNGGSLTFLFIVAPIAGICLSYFWYRMIKSYSDLNTGKFKVVHAIEQRLPISLFETEWEVVGRGKDKNLYLPFTRIEIKIPWIFISLYIVIFLWALPWPKIADLLSKFPH